jgi:hypothetical protein
VDESPPGGRSGLASPAAGAEPVLPGALRGAVLLIAFEAAAVGALAAFLLYEDLTAPAASLLGALFVTGFAIGAAVALAALARALHRRRGGARGPAIVLQLMLLPIGYYMVKGGLGWVGLPLLALGLLVCGLLVSPATTRALGLAERRPNQPG